jgi:erythromycin esterase-like protein
MKTIRRTARRLAIILLIAGYFATGLAAAAQAPTILNKSKELDRLVTDVCNKQVVLLGEDDMHASGKTLEVKVDLVERLVDECGFSAVFFESQAYDFLDLERGLAARTATSAQLADAIGGLWSTTRESDRLAAFLFQAASAGRVKLQGLDPQLGGATQLYSQRDLPARITAFLEPARAEECVAEIHRYVFWEYDDTSPFDDAAKARLRACAGEIQASIAQQPASDAMKITAFMAENFSHFVQMLSEDDSFAARDHAMYDNFVWHRYRLPKGAKIIVWCATIHASKDGGALKKDYVSMGSLIHRSLGDRAVTIGFSALSGSIGRRGKPPVDLADMPPDSLEGRVFAGSKDDIRYVGSKRLQAFGKIAARPVDYGEPKSLDWGSELDGMVVLRRERPPEYVRGIEPQQSAQGN